MKKFISILLCVAIFIGLIPTLVFAATPISDTSVDVDYYLGEKKTPTIDGMVYNAEYSFSSGELECASANIEDKIYVIDASSSANRTANYFVSYDDDYIYLVYSGFCDMRSEVYFYLNPNIASGARDTIRIYLRYDWIDNSISHKNVYVYTADNTYTEKTWEDYVTSAVATEFDDGNTNRDTIELKIARSALSSTSFNTVGIAALSTPEYFKNQNYTAGRWMWGQDPSNSVLPYADGKNESAAGFNVFKLGAEDPDRLNVDHYLGNKDTSAPVQDGVISASEYSFSSEKLLCGTTSIDDTLYVINKTTSDTGSINRTSRYHISYDDDYIYLAYQGHGETYSKIYFYLNPDISSGARTTVRIMVEANWYLQVTGQDIRRYTADGTYTSETWGDYVVGDAAINKLDYSSMNENTIEIKVKRSALSANDFDKLGVSVFSTPNQQHNTAKPKHYGAWVWGGDFNKSVKPYADDLNAVYSDTTTKYPYKEVVPFYHAGYHVISLSNHPEYLKTDYYAGKAIATAPVADGTISNGEYSFATEKMPANTSNIEDTLYIVNTTTNSSAKNRTAKYFMSYDADYIYLAYQGHGEMISDVYFYLNPNVSSGARDTTRFYIRAGWRTNGVMLTSVSVSNADGTYTDKTWSDYVEGDVSIATLDYSSMNENTIEFKIKRSALSATDFDTLGIASCSVPEASWSQDMTYGKWMWGGSTESSVMPYTDGINGVAGFHIMSLTEDPLAGLSFSVNEKYEINSVLGVRPSTLEAIVTLPKGYTDRAGVILGNFGDEIDNVLGMEILANGVPRLYIENEQGIARDWCFYNAAIPTGEPVHVAIVIEENTNEVNCYVNGELKDTLAKGVIETLPDVKLRIGGDYRPANTQYFKGTISLISLYSDARTAAEIEADAFDLTPDTDNILAAYKLSPDATITDLSGKGVTAGPYSPWKESRVEPLDDYDFSIAVIGDTQMINWYYANPDTDNENVMQYLYDWIVDNKDEKKIAFSIGLGDITEYDWDVEWEHATEEIFKQDGVLPYVAIQGNHDSIAQYNKYMSNETYMKQLQGLYKEGAVENSYTTFSVAGIDYLVLCLDYGPDDDVLAWASEVVESFPEHRVIVATHSYLYLDGEPGTVGDSLQATDDVTSVSGGPGSNNGIDIWNKFASQHENIFLILSGHISSDKLVTSQQRGANGNMVTQILCDPQDIDRDDRPSGMVAMLYFSEDGNKMQVEWYSTVQDMYYLDENQFTVDLGIDDKVTVAQIPDDPYYLTGFGQTHYYTDNVTVAPTVNGTIGEGEYPIEIKDIKAAYDNTDDRFTYLNLSGEITDLENINLYASYDNDYIYLAAKVTDAKPNNYKDSVNFYIGVDDKINELSKFYIARCGAVECYPVGWEQTFDTSASIAGQGATVAKTYVQNCVVTDENGVVTYEIAIKKSALSSQSIDKILLGVKVTTADDTAKAMDVLYVGFDAPEISFKHPTYTTVLSNDSLPVYPYVVVFGEGYSDMAKPDDLFDLKDFGQQSVEISKPSVSAPSISGETFDKSNYTEVANSTGHGFHIDSGINIGGMKIYLTYDDNKIYLAAEVKDKAFTERESTSFGITTATGKSNIKLDALGTISGETSLVKASKVFATDNADRSKTVVYALELDRKAVMSLVNTMSTNGSDQFTLSVTNEDYATETDEALTATYGLVPEYDIVDSNGQTIAEANTTLGHAFTMAASAVTSDNITTDGGTSSFDIGAEYNKIDADKVISVTLSWDDTHVFKYEVDHEWDSNNYVNVEKAGTGKWSYVPFYVTVINRSNQDIDASFSFNASVDGVTGKFTDSEVTDTNADSMVDLTDVNKTAEKTSVTLTSAAINKTAQENTIYFYITGGALTENDNLIGSITITISKTIS